MSRGQPTRICVVIPVFNHRLTVLGVARGARRFLPVIVANDGSTDGSGEALAGEKELTLVTLPRNQGKAAALKAGFAKGCELGFTHAITMDADGQHPCEALPALAERSRRHPEAIIVGVRDLKAAGAPLARRLSNGLSTFWFRFETGVRLSDTQCGLRVYPLAAVRQLEVRAGRYAYELEVMVKAAWAGIPLLPHPVLADYAAPTSRLSHFHPWRDFLSVSRVHSRLSAQAFCVPAPLRRLAARGLVRGMAPSRRLRTILRHLFAEHTESRGRLAAAVGTGLFCGIAPIWGAQMLAAAVLAHKFRLNKAITLLASNVSFPLAAPFILAAGLVLGHFLRTGQVLSIQSHPTARQMALYFWEWFAGSVVLAVLAGVFGAFVTWTIARLLRHPAGPGSGL